MDVWCWNREKMGCTKRKVQTQRRSWRLCEGFAWVTLDSEVWLVSCGVVLGWRSLFFQVATEMAENEIRPTS